MALIYANRVAKITIRTLTDEVRGEASVLFTGA